MQVPVPRYANENFPAAKAAQNLASAAMPRTFDQKRWIKGEQSPGVSTRGLRVPHTEARGISAMATSDELTDAKLATVEAKTQTRFVELSGKVDRLSESIMTLTSTITNQLTDVRKEVRSENVFTRWTVVIAVVTSLIGAVAALWVTQGNLLSAFTAGLTLRSETQPKPQQ
jgi:hypothetical protein